VVVCLIYSSTVAESLTKFVCGFPFKASAGWIQDFKNKHKIRQSHVAKYISNKDSATFEKAAKAVELFKKLTVPVIPCHNLDCVINTDQAGCKYCVNVR
jgi:hypothetical protein